MGAIETMLKSEYTHMYRLVSRLREECLQRPKGSIVVKTRGNSRYIYLVLRREGRVVTEYVGKEGTWKAKGIEAKIVERRRYETELREAETQMGRLRKMMKASGVFFVEPMR